MKLYQLLNTGTMAPREDYQRIWLEPGCPLVIAPGCLIHFRMNVQDGKREPALQLAANGETFEAPVSLGFHMNASPHARLYLIPRALELDDQGREQRMLMEFVRLDLSAPLVVGGLS